MCKIGKKSFKSKKEKEVGTCVFGFFNKCACKVRRALGLHTTVRSSSNQKELDQKELDQKELDQKELDQKEEN